MIVTNIIHEYFLAIFNQCILIFEIDKSEIL